MNKRRCSVVVLAAGFSSRMEQAKFALKYDDKKTFLEKILEEYRNFNCEEILIVLNTQGIKLLEELKLNIHKDVKIIENKHPEKERFYSLQLGLSNLIYKENIFIQNVDNPFVDQELLSLLFEQIGKADYIVPCFKGKGGHPILVSKKVRDSVVGEDNYEQNLKEFLGKFVRLKVESLNAKILHNINDYKDYSSQIKNDM
jgi:molybdenum cofactor cytidylyltransferase